MGVLWSARVFSAICFSIAAIAFVTIPTVKALVLEESNLCYGIRLRDECVYKSGQTACNAIEHCFWDDSSNVCTATFAAPIVSLIHSFSRGFAQQLAQSCASNSAFCSYLPYCEEDALTSSCKVSKSGIASSIADPFASDFYYNASTICWPIQDDTTCNASDSCTWTSNSCEYIKTDSDYYDEYCSSTTNWMSSLDFCETTAIDYTCESLDSETTCTNTDGCNFDTNDNKCSLNSTLGNSHWSSIFGGYLAVSGVRMKCTKNGFGGPNACAAASECEWLGNDNGCALTLESYKTAAASNLRAGYLYLNDKCDSHDSQADCNNDIRCAWEHDDDECTMKDSMVDPTLCPDPTIFPNPSLPAIEGRVTAGVILTGYTTVEFVADERQAFVRGIAIYLNVPDAVITIDHVHDVSSSNKRRNLKSSSIEVDFSASGSSDQIESFSTLLNDAGSINGIKSALEFAFEMKGLTIPSSLTVTAASMVFPSPPSPPPLPLSPPPSSGISALNGLLGLISATVVAFVLV